MKLNKKKNSKSEFFIYELKIKNLTFNYEKY